MSLARWLIPKMCILAVFASASTPLPAATFSLEKGDDGFDFIYIDGEIKAGDEDHFRRLAVGSEKAAVVVSGPGGALLTALEIGKTIQLKGFATYVPAGQACTSSCALIWIAGSTRFLTRTSRVGFHASYRDVNGRLEEAGAANAMVGRYLTLLNLPENAVIFATSASPTQISWLTSANSHQVGIQFELLADTASQSKSQTASVTRAPDSYASSRQGLPSWIYLSADDDGAKYYVRGEDVAAGAPSSRAARMWLRTDATNDKTVKWQTAMGRFTINCVDETYALDALTTYDQNGQADQVAVTRKVESIVPDSLLASATDLICSDQTPASDERDIQ
jgi:hypothetical protein